MKNSPWRATSVAVLSLAVLNFGFVGATQAAIVDTGALVRTSRSADLASVRTQLERAEVRSQLEKMGVNAESLDQRLSALSDSELHQLAQDMQNAPAGGDFLAVIGVVFVVLLILEVVGVIDIFKKR